MKIKLAMLMLGLAATVAWAQDYPLNSTWVQGKLRVGPATPTAGVPNNVGANSAAIGYGANSAAAGSYALGYLAVAQGYGAYSLGYGATITGDGASTISTITSRASYVIGSSASVTNADYAYAIGSGASVEANADYGCALGKSAAVAAGTTYGMALGLNTKAESFASTVIGANNTFLGGTVGSWVATDPLLILGNGSSSSSRSNALVVLKNGNTGVGVNAPVEKLEVNGTVKATAVTTTGLIKAGGGVLVPQQGDILMGSFTAGPIP